MYLLFDKFVLKNILNTIVKSLCHLTCETPKQITFLAIKTNFDSLSGRMRAQKFNSSQCQDSVPVWSKSHSSS